MAVQWLSCIYFLWLLQAGAAAARPASGSTNTNRGGGSGGDSTHVPSSRRRDLLEACVGLGGSGCLSLRPSEPPQPSDQWVAVAAELARLTYLAVVGATCWSDCGAEQQLWEANVTAVTGAMGASDTRFLYGNATNTEGILVATADKFIVAFRGTEFGKDEADIRTNMAARLSSLELGPGLPSDSPQAAVHEGFAAAATEVYDAMVEALLDVDPTGSLPVYMTGHSLGGALAVLSAALLQSTDAVNNTVKGVVTFGGPRVGNLDWAAAYKALGLDEVTLRFVNEKDIVPLVPPPGEGLEGFTHVGQVVLIDDNGTSCLHTNSPAGSCSSETCGAYDFCLAQDANFLQECASVQSQLGDICAGNGLLGTAVQLLLGDALESSIGSLLCSLVAGALDDAPSCCMLLEVVDLALKPVTEQDYTGEGLGAFISRVHGIDFYLERVSKVCLAPAL